MMLNMLADDETWRLLYSGDICGLTWKRDNTGNPLTTVVFINGETLTLPLRRDKVLRQLAHVQTELTFDQGKRLPGQD